MAWDEVTGGDRGESLRNSIAAYEAALTVEKKSADPEDWATTQQNLAAALADMAEQPGVDRAEWLVRAIGSDRGAVGLYGGGVSGRL